MQPLVCACERCSAMCASSTCLPTPDEARALIRAGFADRLATYKFSPHDTALRFVGPAPAGQEGARDVPHNRVACTFHKDGLCELHHIRLKPLEGRLAHHDRPWLPIREHVAGTWKGRKFHSVAAQLDRATASA